MFKMRPTPALGLLALAALIFTSTAWAQRPPSREEREQHAAQRMEELRTRLELSADQEQQIEPILDEAATKGRELHEKFRDQERSRSTMEGIRDEMRKLHEEVRAELEPILTAEQLEEFDAVHEEWRAERRKKMEGQRRGPGQQRPI